MKVYDTNGNLLETYDLTKGKLKDKEEKIYHEAKPAVEEISHWEEKHHDNGSISRRKVITQPAVAAEPAWEEYVEAYTYEPYTAEELEALNKPTAEQRIAELEAALLALLEGETE